MERTKRALTIAVCAAVAAVVAPVVILVDWIDQRASR